MSFTETKCESCQRSFLKRNSAYNRSVRRKAKHYCSRTCAVASRLKPELRTECKQCASIFKRPGPATLAKRGNRGKFCTKRCYTLWQRENPKDYGPSTAVVSTSQKCAFGPCQNKVLRRHKKTQKYCSVRCAVRQAGSRKSAAARSTYPICPVCGDRTKTRKSKHCSSQCWQIVLSRRKGARDYKRGIFATQPNECHVCKYRIRPALVIHHQDGNRQNNCPDNLCILCANCHSLVHRGAEGADVGVAFENLSLEQQGLFELVEKVKYVTQKRIQRRRRIIPLYQRVTPEDCEHILERRAQGVTIKDLAESYKVASSSIRKILDCRLYPNHT
jgi:hypothetical protein